MSNSLTRGAGVLMPISSLPSEYGIGTLGKEAYNFADWLYEAGQKYWQVLPVGPTSFGDSPYQSFSAFAGNPYFIDLDELVSEGLLKESDLKSIKWYDRQNAVDYEKMFKNRFTVLKKAFKNSKHREDGAYHDFVLKNTYWIEDYSLFMALKDANENKAWSEWEHDIRFRYNEAIGAYRHELWEEMEFWKFVQYKFFEQWNKLKKYVNEKGIKIIGDIPLYVSLDSVDVWAHNRLFEMDERRRPTLVAGVPPDCFSEDGQLWGNPIYKWQQMEAEDFDWWRRRMASCSALYDVIRIDHFIGIVRYYAIPAECDNAKTGEWKQGPGERLTKIIEESVKEGAIIAEDLGVITPPVRELMTKMNWPGMKIYEFAFDGQPFNDYLPHNFKSECCVFYAGTHDNDTIVGFVTSADEKQLKQAMHYLEADKAEDVPARMIKSAYASVAKVVIIQMQDILGLGSEARINIPATAGGNWQWRMKRNQNKLKDAKRLSELARYYAR